MPKSRADRIGDVVDLALAAAGLGLFICVGAVAAYLVFLSLHGLAQ